MCIDCCKINSLKPLNERLSFILIEEIVAEMLRIFTKISQSLNLFATQLPLIFVKE